MGSSGSGKSVLITEILNNFTKCTDSNEKPIYVYCYKTQLPSGLIKTQNSFVYQGIPNLKNFREHYADGKTPIVLVFDDLLSDLTSLTKEEENEITNLIIDYSRKLNIRYKKYFFQKNKT